MVPKASRQGTEWPAHERIQRQSKRIQTYCDRRVFYSSESKGNAKELPLGKTIFLCFRECFLFDDTSKLFGQGSYFILFVLAIVQVRFQKVNEGCKGWRIIEPIETKNEV